MSKFNRKNQTGAAGSQQVLIIAIITIAAALMIVAIFVILKNRKTTDSATNDFLKNIEAQRQGQNRPDSSNTATGNQTTLSYTGVLTEINTDSLVITEKDSQNKITIFLTATTPVMYNGQPFSRTKFYVGDQLQITAKNLGDRLQAESVTVIVSASPATAAPVPIAPNVRPDGTIKPLGSD